MARGGKARPWGPEAGRSGKLVGHLTPQVAKREAVPWARHLSLWPALTTTPEDDVQASQEAPPGSSPVQHCGHGVPT